MKRSTKEEKCKKVKEPSIFIKSKGAKNQT